MRDDPRAVCLFSLDGQEGPVGLERQVVCRGRSGGEGEEGEEREGGGGAKKKEI